MAQLRSEKIIHLGQVKRLYLESTGDFSMVRQENPTPGLLALPSSDQEFVHRKAEFVDVEICLNCGHPGTKVSGRKGPECKNCGQDDFTKAVRAKE